MNKTELVDAIAKKTGLTKKQAKMAVDAFIDVVKGELMQGGKVRLIGFGTFEVRKRAARKGMNPRTKQPITIPERKVPAFKPSNELKKLIK